MLTALFISRSITRPQYPQRCIFLAITVTTRPGGIAFTYYKQVFPNALAVVFKQMHKALEPPVIIHHAVAHLRLALLLSYAFVDTREMEVTPGLLLALVALGAILVQLLVAGAIDLEAADVVEAALIAVAHCLLHMISHHLLMVRQNCDNDVIYLRHLPIILFMYTNQRCFLAGKTSVAENI